MAKNEQNNFADPAVFNSEQISVVSLTRFPNWYSEDLRSIGDTDKVRGDLALKSIAVGMEKGYQVVIADSESSSAFHEELARYPKLTIVRRQERDRAPGRRAGIIAASKIDGVEVILSTEPEKKQVVGQFVPQLAGPIFNKTAELVVAKRNSALFHQTYPAYMWQSETSARAKYNQLLHRVDLLPPDQELDLFFGPILFLNRPDVLQLFLKKYQFVGGSEGVRRYLKPEDFSDARYFPTVEALHQGLKVDSVEVDFQYPVLQKENEEAVASGSVEKFTRKRSLESRVFVDELIHLIRYLNKDPKSGLIRID